jgi:hypothetical protein
MASASLPGPNVTQ